MSALEEWVSLYVRDVRENPEAYKPCMDHETRAQHIVEGLSAPEIRRMTRELMAERKAIAKAR